MAVIRVKPEDHGLLVRVEMFLTFNEYHGFQMFCRSDNLSRHEPGKDLECHTMYQINEVIQNTDVHGVNPESEVNEIESRIMEQEEQVDDLPNMGVEPKEDTNVYLAREGIRRSELHDHYNRYCAKCHIIAVHSNSKSGICPDCAAEIRATTRSQILGCGCIRENTGNKLSESSGESTKERIENIIERDHERNQ